MRLFAFSVMVSLAVGAAPAAAADLQPNPDGIAVIVANTNYAGEGMAPHPTAAGDAAAMRRFLVQRMGFDDANVIDLANADLATFVRTFGSRDSHKGALWRRVRPGRSDILVYYAGHGITEPLSLAGHLLPSDGALNNVMESGYPLDLLYANLAKLKARTRLVLLEAGFNAAFVSGPMAKALQDARDNPVKLDGGVTVLRAAGPGETARHDGRHGLFTKHLLAEIDTAAQDRGQVLAGTLKTHLDAAIGGDGGDGGERQTVLLLGDGGLVIARAAARDAESVDDRAHRVLRRAPVRAAPDARAIRLATLEPPIEIDVTGKLADSGWATVSGPDGLEGYVEVALLKALPKPSSQPPPGGGATGTTGGAGGAAVGAFKATYAAAVRAYNAKDYLDALKHFRVLASQGNAAAQNYIGYMYRHGHGVEQSDNEALNWYRMAAEQDLPTAQFNLGYMYDTGTGVRQDYVEARRWYEKAAQAGSPAAQNGLGYLHRMGRGTPKDYDKAVDWYRKAVAQGYTTAQVNLGAMYYYGYGVPKNLEEAKRLFEKAERKGNKTAERWLQHLRGKE